MEHLAQVTTDQTIEAFGLPAALVIIALVSTVVYLVRRSDKNETRYQEKLETIQDKRIEDAKETRDKILEPLEKQAALSQRILDAVLNDKSRR